MIATKMRIGFDQQENARTRDHEREQQRRQLQYDTDEEWRDRRIRAADDFSTGVEQAILGVRNLIDVVAEPGGIGGANAEVGRLVFEAVARLARIKLLFGEESDPVLVAKNLLAELDVARRLAADPKQDSWEALNKVYLHHKTFNTAALKMINERSKW